MEVFPTVSFNLAVGEQLEHIDVALDAVTARLRAKGMQDDDIQALKIEFTGMPSKDDTLTNTTLGEFNQREKVVRIFSPHRMQDIAFPLKLDGKKGYCRQETGEVIAYSLNNTLVHELEHASLADDEEMRRKGETYHANAIKEVRERDGPLLVKKVGIIAAMGVLACVASQTGNDMEGGARVAFGLLPLPVAGVSIAEIVLTNRRFKRALKRTSYERYVNDPEELQARRAAAENDVTYVTLTPKVRVRPAEERNAALLEASEYLLNGGPSIQTVTGLL